MKENLTNAECPVLDEVVIDFTEQGDNSYENPFRHHHYSLIRAVDRAAREMNLTDYNPDKILNTALAELKPEIEAGIKRELETMRVNLE